jgi:hypothetical protein
MAALPSERDARYWKWCKILAGRAAKARVAAEQFTDSDARRAMLTVAESYDLMAQIAERHADDREKWFKGWGFAEFGEESTAEGQRP